MIVHDEDYSRNAPCALNSIFMFLLDKCLKLTKNLLNQKLLVVMVSCIFFVFLQIKHTT